MSEFSDLLSLLIKTRDINVSTLTGYCDLDRSTMYKLINGKRTPTSKELVEKLSIFMNLNPIERQELMEAYRLTKAGWDTYYRRKNVREFILNFTGLPEKALSTFTPPHDFSGIGFFSDKNTADSVALTSQLQLSSAIHKILFEAASAPMSTISFFAQPEHLESLNIATLLPAHTQGTKIQHILCINNSKSPIKSQQNYNIQCLKKIIPFYGIPFDYQAFYYYDNINSHFNNLNFMPCLFLTDTAAIICSSDLKEGALFRDKNILSLFRKRFQDILSKTNPLALGFASNLVFHLKSFASVYKGSPSIYGLAAEPCLLPSLTPELLEKYLKKDLPQRDSLIVNLEQYLKSFSSSNTHLYFTKDGVLNFLMSGRLHEIPNALYHPIETADRILLLKKLCKQIENSWNIRLLKGSMEKFPLNLNLLTTPSYGFIIFSTQYKELSYILLKEQNILTSFYDFACSLEENDALETKEETLDFLYSLIK